MSIENNRRTFVLVKLKYLLEYLLFSANAGYVPAMKLLSKAYRKGINGQKACIVSRVFIFLSWVSQSYNYKHLITLLKKPSPVSPSTNLSRKKCEFSTLR